MFSAEVNESNTCSMNNYIPGYRLSIIQEVEHFVYRKVQVTSMHEENILHNLFFSNNVASTFQNR